MNDNRSDRHTSPRARNGIIDELIAGSWRDPEDGELKSIPLEAIEIADTLEGREADLVRARHGTKRLCVVHDENTRAALGGRVLDALRRDGATVSEYLWENPKVTPETATMLSEATADAEALIAVGSGSISDGAKYATFLDGREYSVFATSPMNAYTTPTASVSFDGFKKSLTCHSAKGVFFDLGVLADCPKRLVSAAFADVVCRTTAQVDWLMSHLLFGTPYSATAYTLLAYDEGGMVRDAARLLEGDFEALAQLTRVSAILGTGTSFTGTTHMGSMAEHMISHCIDMFARPHPGSSHGEQVGVATLTMSALQNDILGRDRPPELRPTAIPEERLRATYGDGVAETMLEETRRKALDEAEAARLNERLRADWDRFRSTLVGTMRPHGEIERSMRAAGCRTTAAELGLDPASYRRYVRDARFIRDRFSMLDVADDSGQLDEFVKDLT